MARHGKVGYLETVGRMDLEDMSKVPALTEALVAWGHSDEVILKFLGEKYLRVFETVWGA